MKKIYFFIFFIGSTLLFPLQANQNLGAFAKNQVFGENDVKTVIKNLPKISNWLRNNQPKDLNQEEGDKDLFIKVANFTKKKKKFYSSLGIKNEFRIWNLVMAISIPHTANKSEKDNIKSGVLKEIAKNRKLILADKDLSAEEKKMKLMELKMTEDALNIYKMPGIPNKNKLITLKYYLQLEKILSDLNRISQMRSYR